MFYFQLDKNNKRIYSMSKKDGEVATPARFSPADQYSYHRIQIKQKYGVFPFDDYKQINNK